MKRLASLLCCALSVPLLANDTLLTIGAGGLVPLKSAEVEMVSENLHVSLTSIEIDYVFRNTSSHDVETLVGFPLPPLDGQEVYFEPVTLPKADLNYLDFRVLNDSKPVQVQRDTKAITSKTADIGAAKDVTNYLRLVGAPIDVTAYITQTCPLPSKMQKQLEIAGLLGDECAPLWETRTQFYWTQRFPANAEVRLHQTYRPVVGGGYGYFQNDGSHVETTRCGDRVDPSLYQRWKARRSTSHEGEIDYYYRELSYILTTAKNWKGRIGTFTLTIDVPYDDDLLATCEPGLKKISATRYALVQKDFVPNRELELTIYTTHKPPESSAGNAHLQ